MPYITREDGEHFVIPSYRDVIAVSKKSQLKKDILQLSESYGEYITLQRKNAMQYEVAFSPDTGYLLGETVWHHFKRPLDMIYCEAIPNTTEVILVIVRAGSVYLDGQFPSEGIAEELIVFLTQENYFDVYTYGDVPISETPEAGKFSFETKSIKSFNILDKPVFPALPLLRAYRLQLVDTVLKAQGIGVFPLKQILGFLVAAGILWILYSYMTTPSEEIEQPVVIQTSPYQAYNNALSTPAPDQEINLIVNKLTQFFTIPGWYVVSATYANNTINAIVQSIGTKINELQVWANHNNIKLSIQSDGIHLLATIAADKRVTPTRIYPLEQVVARVIDNVALVYPGNNIDLGKFENKGVYKTTLLTIKYQNISPMVLNLIAQNLQDLPLVLEKATFSIDATFKIKGSLNLQVLGN